MRDTPPGWDDEYGSLGQDENMFLLVSVSGLYAVLRKLMDLSNECEKVKTSIFSGGWKTIRSAPCLCSTAKECIKCEEGVAQIGKYTDIKYAGVNCFWYG